MVHEFIEWNRHCLILLIHKLIVKRAYADEKIKNYDRRGNRDRQTHETHRVDLKERHEHSDRHDDDERNHLPMFAPSCGYNQEYAGDKQREEVNQVGRNDHN